MKIDRQKPAHGNGDAVVETYSRLANAYDDPRNIASCWGRVTHDSFGLISLRARHETVVDVGCGTGHELTRLASNHAPHVRFVGVEPAGNMREIAAARAARYPNVRIVDGRFERLPLETHSVDYLYSILAFHWTTDPHKSVAELARVLRAMGELDLTFIGRNNGREFIKKTTPVFFKYLTPAMMVEAVSSRQQLTLEAATALFREAFDSAALSVTESYHTYYDTLEGHWAWWVRIEGQFINVPPDKKSQCDEAVRAAISTLQTPDGIPYTVHLLHVRLRHV
jgi:ubiquinone/menaquinone biosynthesis C-methylase UbiE